MIRKKTNLGAAAIALLVSTGNAMDHAAMHQSLQQWLGNLPGGVAAAYVDATGVAFFNAGKFSVDDARPVTPDTEFEIGSVTKVFTALLLADSVRAGKVKLDAPVGAPFAASEVTFEQLATHTSGLPRLPADFMASDPLNPYAASDLAALEKSFAGAVAGAKPTKAAVYSNFGFAVLGQALAGAWSEAYGPLLKRRILQPLGMDDTVLSWRDADPARLAPGLGEQGSVPHWDLNAYAPAGALVATTRDLAKFVQACLGFRETRLAPALAMMTEPHLPPDAWGHRIGLAWVIEQRDGNTIFWHNGGTGGFRSFVGYDPVQRIGVVVLTNHTRGVEPLAFALLAGRALPPEATPKPGAPADKLKAYLGHYPLAPSFVIAVTADGDDLFLQATGQPRLKLREAGTDHYAVIGVDAQITFERDATGKVTALVLHQNGVNQRAPHLAPGDRPRMPEEIALSERELDDYVGSYRLGSVAFTVKREGGRLMVQLTGQPFLEVFASSKDEFFYKVVDAQISFVRGDGGKVAALVLHQSSRDQRAERLP